MIWRKSWWECRFRVLLGAILAVAIIGVGLAMLWSQAGAKNPQETWTLYSQAMARIVVPMIALLMAGSGINSQTSWGMLHGFHPSMHFMLSLPVSRRRAFFVRSAMGAIFTLAYIVVTTGALGLLAPLRGVHIPRAEVLEGMALMTIYAFGFGGLATFLTTLFDEFWAGVFGLTLVGVGFGGSVALGAARDSAPPQFTVGWLMISGILAMGIVFMLASVYVIERKEY
jgi:hypothetical protein